MEDWSSVNFIQSLNCTTVNKTNFNRNQQGEFWLKTLWNNEEINCLVDTGSPRLFISRQTAKMLTKKLENKIVRTEAKIGGSRCFNNNKIQLDDTIQLDLKSVDTEAHKCQILVFPQNTVNLLGRDKLQKLRIHLAYTKPGEKIQNTHSIQNQIAKWVFQKYPHLCTGIGKSKNHVAKSKFHQIFHPTQHKGRGRVPLRL